ncbi:MAG: hypothetical protein A3F78_08050 [Burkholderiales bacterium RIFCSPLOWO2_12_FULL_61_40]|nr:MAG: hypothetical protein A3F78_08050 [Burkholderiales bacterium RIFCSPLOWO2_12_FULL_61_40]
MQGQHPSFANRVTGYFGALFLAAMGFVFYGWYFGLPQLGIPGASNQRLMEASRILEARADHQDGLITEGLKERRGDVLVVAENKLLAEQLSHGNASVQKSLLRVFDRLQRAYPGGYARLRLVDPTSQLVRASSEPGDVGQLFEDPALIERAVQPGAAELIEPLAEPGAPTSLAIVRQMHAPDKNGYPNGKLVGIVVATIELGPLVGEGFQDEDLGMHGHNTTLLFDAAGQNIARFPRVGAGEERFRLAPQVSSGFEGTLLQTDTHGTDVLVVYRHVVLSGSQGWTLVHFASKDNALGELQESANSLMVMGLLLTLVSLAFIRVAARHLTRPLHLLAQSARQLGAGDLFVRVLERPDESLEIHALSEAFNGMAGDIQKAHRTLEDQVQVRTAELASARDRAQGYLDIAGIMLLALDLQGRIAMVNRQGCILLEKTEAELIGLDWFDHFILPQDRQATRTVFGRVIRGELRLTAHHENEIITATGKRLLLAWNNATLRDASGAITGSLSSAEDVTERRRAEAELRIAAIAFESQEGMYVADGAWTILRVNQAFTAMTGYSAQEAVGQIPHSLLNSGRHDSAFYERMHQGVLSHGTWQGEVWDRRKNGDIFPVWLIITAVKTDAGVLTHYVATLSDITQRKAAEDQIRNLAFYDPLTQLPNRRLLMERLEKALATGTRHLRKGALLFIDLDNFKTLNDTLGHDMGDLLLQQVAKRLSTCVREYDTVARLGGDEFVVMLEDLSESALEAATQAETVGEKILRTLNQVYLLASHEHHSTPSIGVTLFGEQHEGIDEPLKRADLAMYQAKAAGRNTLRFFDPQMQAVVAARAALEAGLREALVRGQFLLHYQVQVATGPGSEHRRMTGAEVLVRWKHPARGMVSPAEFIPLAEETGLILPLGQWVLETACAQLAQWAHTPALAHLTIAVNVSARQFHQFDFVQQVHKVLDATGANPQRLKLELTEGLLVSNIEDVIAKMGSLKSLGVGFSLDDFGTGYSSLSYLKRLPLDQLKIDQSFVRDILVDPNDAAIAHMVVVLANSLGLAVIAEGVETEAQKAFLASQGCHAYQGYLFSRPLPLAEFEAFVTQGQAPG